MTLYKLSWMIFLLLANHSVLAQETYFKHQSLGPVDLCCIYFTQQYMGSHIIENASDTMLA